MSDAPFKYRPRHTDRPFTLARSGTTVAFEEHLEYIVSFARDCDPATAKRLLDLGGEIVSANTAVLGFRNYVGRTELATVTIDVVSSKLGADGTSRVLQEVSELASNLVFGWRSRIGLDAKSDQSHFSPVPYHQFQMLRRSMLAERPGWRLQDWFDVVERSPTRRFEPDRPLVPPDRVRRLDHRATASVFSRLDRLVPVPAQSRLVSNPLAQALMLGFPAQPHFPRRVAAPRGRLSFDTPENRFAKHLLSECLALVYRFADHPKLHPALRDDCRLMLTTLVTLSEAPFLADVGSLSRFQAPSQALARGDGYRDLFAFWVEISRHASLPRTAAETRRLLDGKDVATLYEYWVFLKVLEAVSLLTGSMPSKPPVIDRDEFGESLSVGLPLTVGATVTVRFNPTYRRTTGTAYSTPLRPDVVVETQQGKYAFDAKYRLTRLDVGESEADDDPATYKRADLYKMHTYRDAIERMRAAFVVYPGSEFVFFERSGQVRSDPKRVVLLDGVGAVPLRPADGTPAAQLREVLSVLLTPAGWAGTG